MVLIETAFGVKLVYALGITNIVFLLLVLFSCRCMFGVKIASKIMQKERYKKFYSLHCYYWWLFIISVLLHTILAFLIFGNPF